MSMKKSIDTIVNRTRDLPACRTVPQPTEPPRSNNQTFTKLLHVLLRYSKVHCFVLRPSRWFGDERKCGGKIKADFFIRNFLYFDIRLNEWYSDMRIQCHVYTVTCVYSDMCLCVCNHDNIIWTKYNQFRSMTHHPATKFGNFLISLQTSRAVSVK